MGEGGGGGGGGKGECVLSTTLYQNGIKCQRNVCGSCNRQQVKTKNFSSLPGATRNIHVKFHKNRSTWLLHYSALTRWPFSKNAEKFLLLNLNPCSIPSPTWTGGRWQTPSLKECWPIPWVERIYRLEGEGSRGGGNKHQSHHIAWPHSLGCEVTRLGGGGGGGEYPTLRSAGVHTVVWYDVQVKMGRTPNLGWDMTPSHGLRPG